MCGGQFPLQLLHFGVEVGDFAFLVAFWARSWSRSALTMLDSPAGSGEGGASRGVVAAVWEPVNGCRPPRLSAGGVRDFQHPFG